MRTILGLLLALGLTGNGLTAPQAHTAVEMLIPVESARPGDTITVGIRLKMESGWHTYWKYPGDAGGPTEIEWELPDGISAGDIEWPAPERLDEEGLTTFIYHGEVTLLVPLQMSTGLAPGVQELKAKVSWLECEALCLPGQTTVSGKLQIGAESKPSLAAATIEQTRAQLPEKGNPPGLQVQWEDTNSTNQRALLFEWPANGAESADFFPYASDDYDVQFTPERLPVDSSRFAMRLTVRSDSGTWPAQIDGVIIQTVKGDRHAYLASLAPSNAQADAPVGERSERPGAAKPFPPFTMLVSQMLAALLGGLILNLMPCVLPILSLKALHIVKQHGASSSENRRHAIVYTLGVLVSFWIFAGLVIGKQLVSVGGQFQSPLFVVAITVLVMLVSLNLFGLFEVVLPGGAVGKANDLSSKEGLAGSFFKGLLAVVLGASCVAPVFAPVVGWAFSQSAPVILLTFSMIGLGLALPFLLISFFPVLQSLLPKPGPWMQKFKIAMGFPMLATAIWLLSQTADHFGSRGPLWVGMFLVVLALAAWVYGEFHQRGRSRRGIAAVLALVLAGGGYAWALEYELDWRNPPASLPEASAVGPSHPGEGIAWEAWSTEAVNQARAEGRPVLVDFTANWCLTCQLNKKTSLEIDAVRAKLKEINAVALLGDYTRKNPEITAELQRFERAGVPLVLVYPKDASKPPAILPTILTPEIVLNALDAAAD